MIKFESVIKRKSTVTSPEQKNTKIGYRQKKKMEKMKIDEDDDRLDSEMDKKKNKRIKKWIKGKKMDKRVGKWIG